MKATGRLFSHRSLLASICLSRNKISKAMVGASGNAAANNCKTNMNIK